MTAPSLTGARGPATILAIDPGSEQSAWLLWMGHVERFGIEPNAELLLRVRDWHGNARLGALLDPIWPYLDAVVIEKIESYGMAVGADVFETVRWAGRFEEAAHPTPVVYLPRRKVKLNLCGSPRAKDPNVRQALIDRFGGARAQGTKREPGPLYGISRDVWSALAIAVTYSDEVAA